MLLAALNEVIGEPVEDCGQGGATAFLHHLSAKTRSMGETFEQSPTLTAARVPAATHKAD